MTALKKRRSDGCKASTHQGSRNSSLEPSRNRSDFIRTPPPMLSRKKKRKKDQKEHLNPVRYPTLNKELISNA
jgi:hypothetical protein